MLLNPRKRHRLLGNRKKLEEMDMDTNEVDWETYCFTEFDEGQTRRVMDGEEQVLCGTRS